MSVFDLVRCVALLCVALSSVYSQNSAAAASYTQFESPQTHSLRLSPDGSRLFAVDTDGGQLVVFSLSDPSHPTRIAEIPVGLEPVSVWPLSNDEAWVVSHVSDTVSVVSVSRGIVVDTLIAGDEPADILVAGSRAFVSAARSKELRVFDVGGHGLVATIPLLGEHPRALALSADGAHIYVAFALSGNRTTLVPRTAEIRPPAEPPVPGLPLAPRVGLIVDALDPDWSSQVPITLLDHDVAEIDTASLSVSRYFDRTGTVNLGIAVQPGSGDLYVSNTDARNLVFFEPALRGHVVDNRISRIAIGDGQVSPLDLNAGVDYGVLPNPAALSSALAQPTDLLFEADGAHLWLAAYGTDRVARFDVAGGSIDRRIEIGSAPGAAHDAEHKRGPRGLALRADVERLYVLNRISATLSVIDTAAATVIEEQLVSSNDSLPDVVRQGRGYLYDAKLSGNGNASCASCHVDGGVDNLAWNLGNPNGQVVMVHDPISASDKAMHPMKGPMVTQTLAGLDGFAPYHWRGDVPDLNGFNRNFDVLLGASQLSDEDMGQLADFLRTIGNQPNPHLNLDRSLSDNVNGASAVQGRTRFQDSPSPVGEIESCASCHSLPDLPFRLQVTEPVNDMRAAKVPTLRQVYKKTGYRTGTGEVSTLGFGQTQDGAIAHVTGSRLSAFQLSWDSGTAPAVGFMRTLTASTIDGAETSADWSALEALVAVGDIVLTINGDFDGSLRSLFYDARLRTYRDCASGDLLSHQALVDLTRDVNATFTLLGLPPDRATCADVTLFGSGFES